jgi:hypothetical protein
VYKDWIVACDNALSCTAVSLQPDREGEWGVYGLVVTRGPAADDAPVLRFIIDQDTPPSSVDIALDGKVLTKGKVEESEVSLSGPVALEVARAATRGSKLELSNGTASLGDLSLSGLSAALRYMDAQQTRANGVTAFVARGSKPATAVKQPPALPVIKAVAITLQTEIEPLRPAELTRAIKAGGCEEELDREQVILRGVELSPLDAEHTLVLLPCGAGAYQSWSSVLIARGKVGSREFTPAPFDNKEAIDSATGVPVLTEASWDPKTGRLYDSSRGRGVGDCGSSSTHVWDGSRFRLVNAQAMPECRGSLERITIWRADVSAP